MDFSRECLDKKSEFGVLWFYGNKEGRIVPRDVERLDVHTLFKFIQVHKDVIAHQHWVILFRGFFVIMLNRLELIHRQFKNLHLDIKRKSKPTFSEFQLLLNETVDLDIDFLTLQPPPPPPEQKQPRRLPRKSTLIREAPSVLLGDQDLDITSDALNVPLVDDGFGGNLNTEISANEFFDLGAGAGSEASQQRRPHFEQDDDFDFPTSQPTSQPASQPASQPTSQPLSQRLRVPAASLPDLNVSADPSAQLSTDRQFDSLATIQRPPTIQDESSIQPSRASASGVEGDAQSLGAPELPPGQAERSVHQQPEDRQQPENQQQEPAESEASFSLSELGEPRRRRARRGRGVILDAVIEHGPRFHANNQRYQERNVHRHGFALPGFVPVSRLFGQPVISKDIPLIRVNYTTERRETAELVIREIPTEEHELPRADEGSLDGIDSLPVSPVHSGDYGEEVRASPTEQISRNLLGDIVDQVSLQVDRQLGRPAGDRSSMQYSDRVELLRASVATGISQHHFSDFEPMTLRSDHTADASGLHERREADLDSVGSYKAYDDGRAGQRSPAPSQSTTSEFSFTFFETILDQLKEKNGQTTFSELTRNFKRRDAAKMFADLLTLKMRGEIELIQEPPKDLTSDTFAEIQVLRV